MKVVGRRRPEPAAAIDDQGRLARVSRCLQPGGLAETGVYRFDSFEEAAQWQTDGAPLARAPEPEDLARICRALNAAGARYVLIGGFAMIAHGAGRFTGDIDLLVDDVDEDEEHLPAAGCDRSSVPRGVAARPPLGVGDQPAI